jgi:hypothetical protein
MIGLVAVYGQKGSDGFTDEERPYEFGFNIEGYQHRHEKKDEKGIIMGEFGFITADGIYHVTVYATDENGDFKILKMKNIKVGFPPGSALKPTTPTVAPSTAPPTTKPPIQPTSRLGASSSTAKPTSRPEVFSNPSTFSTTPKIKFTEGCSNCKVPVPTTKKPFSSLTDQQASFPPRGGSFGTPRPQTGIFGGQFSPPGGNVPPAGDIFSTINPPSSIFAGTPPPSSAHPQVAGIFSTPLPPSGIFGRPSLPAEPGGITSTPHPPAGAFVGQSSPEVTEGHTIGEVTGTPRPPSGSFFGPSPPAGPGRGPLGVEIERTGLPKGITEADIMKLLYRFNYTVGFHGHHEEGYRNGDKVGGYFVNGRNGISTQVKYIANEFGYQPNITFVPIGLDSPDTPKEETEKNYGLKGYAFDWFYKR